MTASKESAFDRKPHRTLLGLTIPVLGSLIAEPLTGLVDTAFVKELGPAPGAALGLATIALSSLVWVFSFLGVGTQTEIASARGQEDPDLERRIGSTALTLALGIGTLLALVAWILLDPLVTLLGAEGLIHDHAVSYLTIRLPTLPAVLVSFTCFGILRGSQNMKTPLWIAIGINLLNIVLDGILIFGVGPIPAFGFKGAAWASTVSLILGSLFAWYSVRPAVSIQFIPDSKIITSLLKVGRDMFIRTGSLTLFLVLATRSATALGPEAGAAHQAIRSVWLFLALLLDAWAASAQSLVAFNLGNGKIKTARRVANLATLWAFSTGVAITFGMLVWTNSVNLLLVPPEARDLFPRAWFYCALFQPINALSFVTDGIHWGTRDYAFLRNGMAAITVVSLVPLLLLQANGTIDLNWIWLITGGWITLRALLGCIRVWPGVGNAPLKV